MSGRYQQEKAAMVEAAEKAGVVLRHWFMKAAADEAGRDALLNTQIKTTSYADLGYVDAFTAADLESEQTILPVLQQCRDIAILSEEFNPRLAELPDGAQRWVVDPLDGTSRFKQGSPDFSITIALQTRKDGVWHTDAGLVALPMEERLFIAGDAGVEQKLGDRRTMLDRVALQVESPGNRRTVLEDKAIETVVISRTSPAIRDTRLRFIGSLKQAGARHQETYSTAMVMARMASQPSVDATVLMADAMEFAWDVDAGLHIAERAGNIVKRFMIDTEPCIIIARSPALMTALEQTLRDDYRYCSQGQGAAIA